MLNVIEIKYKYGFRYMSNYRAIHDYGFIKAGQLVSYKALRASGLALTQMHIALTIVE